MTNEMVDTAIQADAKRLLSDKRADGNHGFKGRQLEAWVKQRRHFKAGLRKVAKGLKTNKSDFRFPMCPREAVSPYVRKDGKRLMGSAAPRGHAFHPGCVYVVRSTTIKNPKWSGGTAGGATWVRAAHYLIGKAEGNLW
jgi:hypothetical protein